MTSAEKFLPNDTLRIDGKSVVFFSVSVTEYNELVKDTNSDIDEVLSDFNHYADLVADTIKKQGFKPVMTASRYIEIVLDNKTNKIFDRLSNNKNSTGYIISDGQREPIIEFGVGSNLDFIQTFEKFKNKE